VVSARPDLEAMAREWLATNADFVLVHPGGAVTSLAALLEQAEARGRQEAFEPEPTRPDGFPSMDAERAGWQAQLAALRVGALKAQRALEELRGNSDAYAWHEESIWADALRHLNPALADTQAAAAAHDARVRAEGAAESNEDDALRDRMADLLTRTAAALKGPPKPLHLHDWADLPDVATKVVAERDAWRAADDKQAELVWSAVGDTSAWTARIVEARALRAANEKAGR
jgi:hypothetical protein